MTVADIQAAIVELDRRAKTVSGRAYVLLRVWPDRITVQITGVGKDRQFEGNDVPALLEQASDYVSEHDPVLVARTFGIEVA